MSCRPIVGEPRDTVWSARYDDHGVKRIENNCADDHWTEQRERPAISQRATQQLFLHNSAVFSLLDCSLANKQPLDAQNGQSWWSSEMRHTPHVRGEGTGGPPCLQENGVGCLIRW